MDQITELLTDYGPIYQIWMDHWSEKKTVRPLPPRSGNYSPNAS
ncbi:MAG: hypothetical protein ACLR8Y_04930 [Alistipes indistinctus]